MPAPTVPPPANDVGALPFPRRLQRWLDVWPVTKLDRIQTYITLPAFNINVNWQGYSDIVGAFNVEGPNNFSLKALTNVPVSPNYMLCVMWKDSSNNTYRYAIWKNVGEVVYFDIPLYTGQKIGKNFRFEIWSTNVATVSQATSINFYTSVLGGFDYRWSGDVSLVSPDALVTNFSEFENPTQGLLPVTNPVGVTFYNWFRADTNVAGQIWTSKQGNGYIASLDFSGNITTTIDPNLKPNLIITANQAVSNAAPVGGTTPYEIWMLVKYVADGSLITITTAGPSSVLSVTAGALSVDGVDMHTTLKIGHWYIINYWYGAGVSGTTTWDLQLDSLVPKTRIGYAGTNDRASGLLFEYTLSGQLYTTDILIYSNLLMAADVQTQLNYFKDRYIHQFNLPFLFPPNSTPQSN